MRQSYIDGEFDIFNSVTQRLRITYKTEISSLKRWGEARISYSEDCLFNYGGQECHLECSEGDVLVLYAYIAVAVMECNVILDSIIEMCSPSSPTDIPV